MMGDECKCRNKLENVISILTTHSRVLEKHANTIGEIGLTLKRIQADIAGVVDAQKTQNQLTANIHQLWSKLKCVSSMEEGNQEPMTVREDRRRAASDEIRQLSIVLAESDD